MKSIESLVLTRKAHSANKINQIDQVLSSYDYKTSLRASCSSASSFSSKDRDFNTRPSKYVLNDDALERLKNTDNNRKKLFLYASQVLGKLKKITKDSFKIYLEENEDQLHDINLNRQKLKLSCRKVHYYYYSLKRLLEERCVLLLKEESRSCVKQTQKLVSDLKFLFNHETIKLTTMPIKSYNRFIDSSGISVCVLEQLFKKVNYVCDLHSSLKNNYQNIINFFHVGFDMELNQTLLKVNKFQNQLYSEMFFWTHKVLEVFILKLCLADPDSVSPEFLHRVVETFESFNLLFFDKKQLNYVHLTSNYNALTSTVIQSDYGAVLLDFILQYLSHFEAKVAAEKIMQCLIHECKKSKHSVLNEQRSEIDRRDFYVTNSNTSDYYSSSSTIIEDMPHHMHTSMNDTFSIESVFLSFIQRNQCLILKYLYSIMCLDISTPCKMKSDNNENFSDPSTVNKTWNLNQTGYKNRSFVHLEEKYWVLFWEKVFLFSLKLVLEVPSHQYGNAAAGVFLFWPHSYQCEILKLLKFSGESKDISSSGTNLAKKVFHTLLSHNIQESWDKNMSSALSMIHGQYSLAIPVSENRVRTRFGNALCSCLESFETICFNDITTTENLYLQVFYSFQVTLDCFTLLVNIKSRASVSSSDMPSFLLISCSDCVYACKLLEERNASGVFNIPEHLKSFSLANNQKDCISKQIEKLCGHISDAPVIIQQVIFDAVKSICNYKLKKNHWRICNCDNSFESGMLLFSSIEEILNCFTDVIDHIDNGFDILSTITSAVATALLSVLQTIKKNLSSKKIQVIREILFDFLKWLESEQMNIGENDLEELKDKKCLKRLMCIVHIIESSLVVKRSYFERMSNKVQPLMTDFTPEECMILTEEERLYWRMCCRNNFIYFF